MNYRSFVCVAIICEVISTAFTAKSMCGEPAKEAALAADSQPTAEIRLSVEEAKERALLMHRIYAATLDAMHHHYFHATKAMLPARAMEDVFDEVARDTQFTARWISVNTKAMSVVHEPESDFERKAAAELSTGKSEFAVVEKGYYRRAGAIPLTASCIGCHSGKFAAPTATPRYAGLVISIPVRAE